MYTQSLGVDNSKCSDSLFFAARRSWSQRMLATLCNRRLVASLGASARHRPRASRILDQGSQALHPVLAVLPVRINPSLPDISRPLATRSALVVPLGATLRGHLPAQQHGQADQEGNANHQRRSQRREILPHSRFLSTARGGRCSRWARIVSCATPMLIFPVPVRGATACACSRGCSALPTPGRETRPRPRHRSAIAPGTPPRPREYR